MVWKENSGCPIHNWSLIKSNSLSFTAMATGTFSWSNWVWNLSNWQTGLMGAMSSTMVFTLWERADINSHHVMIGRQPPNAISLSTRGSPAWDCPPIPCKKWLASRQSAQTNALSPPTSPTGRRAGSPEPPLLTIACYCIHGSANIHFAGRQILSQSA